MAAKDLIKKRMSALAKEIARSHFEVNQEFYADDAEYLANDGITERKYVSDCAEFISCDIDENVARVLEAEALKEYKRLVKAKYRRR